MPDLTPTRSLAIALADERRTMREGYAFLDEKCLLLAGEMLRGVRQHRALAREAIVLGREARDALAAAAVRHGQHGLQVYPAEESGQQAVATTRSLLGVSLVEVRLEGEAPAPDPAVHPSPEAERLREAFAAWVPKLAQIAGLATSLARLNAEYRRTVRRVRALQDVLIPELDATLADIETRLEDIEREDALAMRPR
jgi:V/A-type H+-transporting ATPase subunit D